MRNFLVALVFAATGKVAALRKGKLSFLGYAGMKRKMLDQVQPQVSVSPGNNQAKQEIQKFLLAVRSYPDHAAKEPGLTFHRHLCSFFMIAANADDSSSPRY